MGINLFIVSFILSLTVVVCALKNYTGCQGEFRGKCLCGKIMYHSKDRYVTNCTNAGFNNAKILSEIPLETEILIFTGNNIPDIPANVFGQSRDYEFLEEINLSNNHIRVIEGQAFHHVPFVTRLILNDNEWIVNTSHSRLFANMNLQELYLMNALHSDTIPSSRGLFHVGEILQGSSLDNLQILDLSYNKIAFNSDEIEERIFCPLSYLKRLLLSNNYIKEIHFQIDCISSLRFLDISSNHINSLYNKTLGQMDANPTLTLDITNNQLECDCNLQDFHDWLRRTKVKVTHKGELTCHKPNGIHDANQELLILEQPKESFQCIQHPLMLSASSKVSYIFIGLAVSTMFILLVVAIVLNSHHIRNATDKVTEYFTKSRQYTSLDRKCTVDEAEAEV